MGMPMELNTMIVTKGKETRHEENLFSLKKKGYRLYPIDIPLSVHKVRDGDPTGTAVIEKVEWESEETTITYRLISLNTTN
ncbi:DUF2584 domain-containing protein [Bacillus thermotolerans]|uniref:DUF2584 domain-containing protein n=1 Tax=Bacillus thermotolerans TaxID=1221996 RepID=A0A0F5IDS4_BACTR|nr:DUF2584 domain-containing protein [Bacillus thermotolerans]KKB37522.1 hypothetical protein QY97_03885 [Bacillus thermotolerans]KKB39724.1 hypothetical protein QY96_02757 [Bacillus thermotolerans]KKB43613.1 hypothetical protein QY95_00005 [Bacillus thermotolerans]